MVPVAAGRDPAGQSVVGEPARPGWEDARPSPTTPEEDAAVPVERADDHPIFELGGNTITSLAAPEPGGRRGRDVPHRRAARRRAARRTVTTTWTSSRCWTEAGTFHIDDDSFAIAVGDSVVVPIGAVHYLEAGDDGATIVATMLGGTKLMTRGRRHRGRSTLGRLMARPAYIADVTVFDGHPRPPPAGRADRRRPHRLGRLPRSGSAQRARGAIDRRCRSHAGPRARRLPRAPQLRRRRRLRRRGGRA